MDDRAALSRVLTDLVREVAGVSAVYSPGLAIAAAALSLADGVTKSHALLAPGSDAVAAIASAVDGVAVRDEPEGLAVTLTIGVNEGAAAAEVCRSVYDAIADYLLTTGERPAASIAVKVGRIG